MRVGVISDVHANLPALEAVFDVLSGVESLVCAGDVVGYNPWPAECVDAVRRRDVTTVMGNHDRAVVSESAFRFNELARAGVDHAREELSPEQLDWLRSLPKARSAVAGRVRIVHGHPADPDRYTYPGDFAPELLGDEDALIMGHTHVQHHEIYDEGIVCNPGSVGQPRDGDPRAAFAVIDLDDRSVDERRVEYDVDRVITRIEDVRLPSRIGIRLRDGL